MKRKAVIHVKDSAIIVPYANVWELKQLLILALAYVETLGDTEYTHYDCWGVARTGRC